MTTPLEQEIREAREVLRLELRQKMNRELDRLIPVIGSTAWYANEFQAATMTELTEKILADTERREKERMRSGRRRWAAEERKSLKRRKKDAAALLKSA